MTFALALSALASLVLLLVDFDASVALGGEHAQARERLESYFAKSGATLLPYQQCLREACLAHSRGDREFERVMYRRVLDDLRAEGRSDYTGLTGRLEADRELERLLSQLLRAP